MWTHQKTFTSFSTVSSGSQRPRWPLLLLLCTLLTLSSCATKPQVSAVVVNHRLASSGISIQRGGSVFEATAGTELKKGDVLQTGPGEEAVLLLENGGVEVTLFENTQVTISSIILTIGDVAVKIKNKLKEAFQVETEFGVAASESTIYWVSVKQDVDIRVFGIEGAVRFYPKSTASVLLQPRQEIAINNQRLQQGRLSKERYNELLRRVNDVERVIKKDSAEYIVPDVLGLSLGQAQKLLRSEGFTLAKPEPVLSNARIGTITGSKPAIGEILKRRNKLVLSYSERATQMPTVIGLLELQALSTLKNANLQVGNIDRRITGNNIPGQVISQSLPGGSRVAVGSTVTLVIEADSVSVPDVRGMRKESAVRILEQSGLKVGSVTVQLALDTKGDEVSYQSISPGRRVEKDSRVNLRVKELGVRVPSLMGLSADRAKIAASRAGLNINFSPNTRGVVVGQSYSAGSMVKRGSTMLLNMKQQGDVLF